MTVGSLGLAWHACFATPASSCCLPACPLLLHTFLTCCHCTLYMLLVPVSHAALHALPCLYFPCCLAFACAPCLLAFVLPFTTYYLSPLSLPALHEPCMPCVCVYSDCFWAELPGTVCVGSCHPSQPCHYVCLSSIHHNLSLLSSSIICPCVFFSSCLLPMPCCCLLLLLTCNLLFAMAA